MVHLIIVLAVLGFCAWLVLQVPMPPLVKQVIVGVMVLFLVIFVLQFIGIDTGVNARL